MATNFRGAVLSMELKFRFPVPLPCYENTFAFSSEVVAIRSREAEASESTDEVVDPLNTALSRRARRSRRTHAARLTAKFGG